MVGHLFLRFHPTEVHAVLVAQPGAWKAFVLELFRRRMSLSGDEWTPWARVAEAAPQSVPLLDGRIPRDALLDSSPLVAARKVAERFESCDTLAELESRACQQGLLHRSWDFTAVVCALWLQSHARDLPRHWGDLSKDRFFEALLLPRAANDRSWFVADSTHAMPPGIPQCNQAHVITASACLSQEFGGFQHKDVAEASLRIFSATWKDPRTFAFPRESPETEGWRTLKEFAPDVYDVVVQRLLSDDLDLFFETIKFDRDRRHYWRKKLRSLVTTSFCFSAETIAKLERNLPTTAEARARLLSALRRARHLTNSSGVDALCLTFRSGVVVEFSQTGNAAYLYSREDFLRLQIGLQKSVSLRALKNRSLGRQLIHLPGWEQTFDDALRWVL
jgi:hypothetical protein